MTTDIATSPKRQRDDDDHDGSDSPSKKKECIYANARLTLGQFLALMPDTCSLYTVIDSRILGIDSIGGLTFADLLARIAKYNGEPSTDIPLVAFTRFEFSHVKDGVKQMIKRFKVEAARNTAAHLSQQQIKRLLTLFRPALVESCGDDTFLEYLSELEGVETCNSNWIDWPRGQNRRATTQ